jgi:hypothetical protein
VANPLNRMGPSAWVGQFRPFPGISSDTPESAPSLSTYLAGIILGDPHFGLVTKLSDRSLRIV